MRATLDYISRKFDEFNRLCFGNSLKPIPFRLTSARSFLGQVAFSKRRTLTGKWHYDNFVFKMSTLLDLPEREVEDVILHEMIHYWILSNQLQDTSPHGRIFRTKMEEINSRFGRNISIKYRLTPEQHDSDRGRRQHIICISRLADGRCGVTVVVKTRLFEMWDVMKRFPGVKRQKWVVTVDPFFNRFPRAMTPKIYPLPESELNEHLKGAVELVRNGNRITTVNLPAGACQPRKDSGV